MKTNIGVFFGGRSTEHEISVISASQAMHAIDRDKYDVTPVYITKDGRWFTGDALFDVANYRDTKSLLNSCRQVYMEPEYGNYNLYHLNCEDIINKAFVQVFGVIAKPADESVDENPVAVPEENMCNLADENQEDSLYKILEYGLPDEEFEIIKDKLKERKNNE